MPSHLDVAALQFQPAPVHRCQHGQGARDSQPVFAKLCQCFYDHTMSTMNISLPEGLKSFVDEQVSSRGYGTSSEYVRELILKEQERLHLRGLLLAGASPKPAAAVDDPCFEALRDRIGNRAAT